MDTGEIIKQLRKEKGITQEELANVLMVKCRQPQLQSMKTVELKISKEKQLTRWQSISELNLHIFSVKQKKR